MKKNCAVLLVLSLSAPAFAQTDPGHKSESGGARRTQDGSGLSDISGDPHAACAAVGYVPAGLLGKPLALRAGTGAGEGPGQAHDAVTTRSAEAQAFYDQGIAYLHSYVWIEAARSFHEALRHDPNLALAHVGLSRVFTGLEDKAAAWAALERAESLSGSVSPRERRRIALRRVHLEALDDLGSTQKHAAYKKAIDDALATDLDDVELWLLRGNAEEATAAGRGQRGGAASVAFYDKALALQPDHFAAHHYLVHSYETIGRIDLALAHGEVYARLAPTVPHAHHMWAHDLRRVGRTQDAIAEFRKADALENAYYAKEGIPAQYDWHHQHNLDLLATSHEHEGQMREAEALMRTSFDLPPPYEYSAINKKEWPGFLLARGRVAEAREAGQTLASSRFAAARAMGYVALGQVALREGRIDEARAEAARAREAFEQVEPGPASARSTLVPYLDLLQGSLQLGSGEAEAGRTLLVDVEKRLRGLPGPDAWMQALFVLESIAFTAREAGDWELADYTALQMLDHDSAYAGAHYAKGLVAEHRGDAAAARQSFAEAARHWAQADPDLPELARVQKRVAAAR